MHDMSGHGAHHHHPGHHTLNPAAELRHLDYRDGAQITPRGNTSTVTSRAMRAILTMAILAAVVAFGLWMVNR